jgi:hypothetical protein
MTRHPRRSRLRRPQTKRALTIDTLRRKGRWHNQHLGTGRAAVLRHRRGGRALRALPQPRRRRHTRHDCRRHFTAGFPSRRQRSTASRYDLDNVGVLDALDMAFWARPKSAGSACFRRGCRLTLDGTRVQAREQHGDQSLLHAASTGRTGRTGLSISRRGAHFAPPLTFDIGTSRCRGRSTLSPDRRHRRHPRRIDHERWWSRPRRYGV